MELFPCSVFHFTQWELIFAKYDEAWHACSGGTFVITHGSFYPSIWHSKAIIEKVKNYTKRQSMMLLSPIHQRRNHVLTTLAAFAVCPLCGAFLLSWNVDIGSIPQLRWSSSIGHMWADQSGPHHRTSASGISYPAAEANPASCLASIGKHGNTEKYPKDLLQKLSYIYIYIICMYIHSKSFGATTKCSQPPVQRCAVVCDHSNRGWVKTRMLPAKKNGNDAWSDTPNQQK